ncbi:MAG: TonB family protein [Opitutaceae bacterium]|jgi:protein TonB|nr:TonB family protein [Opitutaceae bacterium]
MTRNFLIAALVSLLLHAGVAFSGYLFPEAPPAAPAEEEIPVIALDLPPPPEPEEPEVVDDGPVSDEPADVAELAPPMQNDVPSAVIDSPFVQQIQAPPPPGLNRPTNISSLIPTNTRPAISSGKGLGNIFDLAALDQRPEARVRINPVYPFEMRRSGLKGEVVVGFIIDAEGGVRDPYIVRSSHPGFEAAALEAVLKWRFKPGKKGGVNVPTRVNQPLSFTLQTD